jgi:hypothetical protein
MNQKGFDGVTDSRILGFGIDGERERHFDIGAFIHV